MPIPIIGEIPFQFIMWHPTASIACKCTPNVLRFMNLLGIGNRQMCSNCLKRYHIARMLENGSPEIVVELPPEA